VIDCGDPGNPYNGYRHIPGGTKYQAVATYTCQSQHHLQGHKSRVCQGDGTWSGEKPVCLGTYFIQELWTCGLGGGGGIGFFEDQNR